VHVQGEIVFANAASARLLKVDSADALVGTSYERYIQPDSIDEVRQRVGGTYSGEVVGAQEAKMLRADGSALDVEISRSRVLFEGRLAVQSAIRELTERKRAEGALRESEERFRARGCQYGAKAAALETGASGVQSVHSATATGLVNLATTHTLICRAPISLPIWDTAWPGYDDVRIIPAGLPRDRRVATTQRHARSTARVARVAF
jgi:PAS domain S-box-containing protein